jgi:type I restriction enzyme R subunit
VQDEAATILQEKLEVLDGIMHGFNYREYFTATTSRKLTSSLKLKITFSVLTKDKVEEIP